MEKFRTSATIVTFHLFKQAIWNAYNASKARFEFFTIWKTILQNISFHITTDWLLNQIPREAL